MQITTHFDSLIHGRCCVSAERSPAEPEVGIRCAQWEIESSTDEDGIEIALNDRDFRLAVDALNEAYDALLAEAHDGEPSYDLDCGFDPYMGSYSDDC